MKFLKSHKLFEDMNISLKKRLDDIIEHKDQETLDFFIKNGEINVNDIVNHDDTVLSYLLMNSDDNDFDLSVVIEYINDINHQDDGGYTVFMDALFYEQVEYIKQLLKYDIDLNIKNKENDDFSELYSDYTDEIIDYIKNEYPEKWKKYIINKQAKKFKI